jgi:hypothetical protein
MCDPGASLERPCDRDRRIPGGLDGQSRPAGVDDAALTVRTRHEPGTSAVRLAGTTEPAPLVVVDRGLATCIRRHSGAPLQSKEATSVVSPAGDRAQPEDRDLVPGEVVGKTVVFQQRGHSVP